MEDILKPVGEKVLQAAQAKGVAAEAFLLHEKELSIEVINGQVETLKQAGEMGLGVRIINNGRLGFAYSSDLSDQAVQETVNDAIKISAYTDSDEFNIFPTAAASYPKMNIIDNDISQMTLEEKIEMAREVEHIARAYDKRVSIIERSGYDDNEYTALIMNTNGLYACERGNSCGLYIFLVAEENADAQNGFSMMINKKIKDLNPSLVGKEAGYRAVRSLQARKIKSARIPCILEPYVTTRFMGLLAQMVDAESVQKGKSMFAGKVGDPVAASVFNLVDDATYKDGIGSFPFDGEGVPARRNAIIKNGILQGFLYDTYSAQKDGQQSTANAVRGSFRSLPYIGTTNFIIEPGHANPEQMIGDLEKGFYITEVMGMHTANPISGDFSVGAAGIMIENGEMTYPVRGVTIAGNLGSFFQDIETVGNDLRFYGGRAAPTVRLKSLSIAGE